MPGNNQEMNQSESPPSSRRWTANYDNANAQVESTPRQTSHPRNSNQIQVTHIVTGLTNERQHLKRKAVQEMGQSVNQNRLVQLGNDRELHQIRLLEPKDGSSGQQIQYDFVSSRARKAEPQDNKHDLGR